MVEEVLISKGFGNAFYVILRASSTDVARDCILVPSMRGPSSATNIRIANYRVGYSHRYCAGFAYVHVLFSNALP